MKKYEVKAVWIWKTGQDFRLSDNFTAHEFESGNAKRVYNIIAKDLIDVLQMVRDHFGAPIEITSGYRDTEYNAKVYRDLGRKLVSDSPHTAGIAADIQVSGVYPSKVYAFLDSYDKKDKKLGLGIYNNFVHVDVRGRYARWDWR